MKNTLVHSRKAKLSCGNVKIEVYYDIESHTFWGEVETTAKYPEVILLTGPCDTELEVEDLIDQTILEFPLRAH